MLLLVYKTQIVPVLIFILQRQVNDLETQIDSLTRIDMTAYSNVEVTHGWVGGG